MSGPAINSAKRDELLSCILRRQLVIITGAGVSLQTVGYPSQDGTAVAGWLGLLESGVKYCEEYNLVNAEGAAVVRTLIESSDTDDLIYAAQKIHGWMHVRTNARLHWMKQTIGQLRVYDPALITAIQTFGGLIATLNYDSLLCDITKRPPIHWKEQDKIDSYICSDSNEYILHIHGYWKELDSVVLDKDSYDSIASNSKMQQVMQRFARWHTLLFVGCGETFLDPNFQTLIKWCNTALNGVDRRHFILCRECDERLFIGYLKPYGFMEPLSYGSDYAELVPFLSGLASDSGAMALAINPPKAISIAPSTQRPMNLQTISEIWKLQSQ